MAKKIIVGDMAVTGDSQILGDCVVTGDNQILGSCAVTGHISADSIQCPGYDLNSSVCFISPNSGNGVISLTGVQVTAASRGDLILCVDSDNTNGDSSSSFYVMKNTTVASDGTSRLAKLDQYGDLTLLGGITADGLTLNSSACAIAPNSGTGVVTLTGSPSLIMSNTDLVLGIDADGSSNDSSSALYVVKNTAVQYANPDNMLAKLDQYGDLTLLGGITANGLTLDSYACVISPNSGAGIVSLTGGAVTMTGSYVTVASKAGLVLAIDADGGDSTSALYIMKNTQDSEDTNNRLAKLDQYGHLTILGPLTASAVIPFTGAHVYPSAEDLSSHVGSALVLVDGERVELSSADSSKNVVGLLISCQAKGDTETSSLGPVPESLGYICHVAAVGDSRTSQLQGASVCNEGGDIEAGDLLVTSSRPGYLMKQEDDIIRSSTVAKAMQPVNFSDDGVATGVYAYVYCG